MFQRCLICTDLSDGLHRLTNFVPSLAASGLSQIVFLHVIALPEDREIPKIDEQQLQRVRDRLATALAQVPNGVEVKIEVQVGKPIDVIQRVAQTYGSDLIVLGMPTRSLLNEKLFGSTTAGLCQRTAVSILTLRPQLISTYTVEELELRCRHLNRFFLIPYDGGPAADALVQRVRTSAINRPANSLDCCLLCWVLEDSASRRGVPRETDPKQAQEKLDAAKQELESVGLQVLTELRHGNPITEILDAAMEHDISAIAVAPANSGNWLNWSVQDFAQEILRRSWHPVLYFPPMKR